MKKALLMIAVIIAAACTFGCAPAIDSIVPSCGALAIDSIVPDGGDMQPRLSLGMSEQELVNSIGAPDILKNNGSCYYYRVFDVSIILDKERRIEKIYAGKNFSGSITRDDGSAVAFASGTVIRNEEEEDDDELTPLDLIFRRFGKPVETLRRAYAPSTDTAGQANRETEYKQTAPVPALQELPVEYRGQCIVYELYNGSSIIKYKYVLDESGIAFWLDADKQPYATVVYRTPQPAIPVEVLPAEPLIVYFDFDRDAIKDEYIAALDKQAGRLRDEAGLCVSIEGHADEKGTDAYNDALSMRRARSVLNFLAARNVPAERMKITAFGKREPAAANKTPEGLDNPAGRALNRRVRIHTVDCAR